MKNAFLILLGAGAARIDIFYPRLVDHAALSVCGFILAAYLIKKGLDRL